VSLSGFIVTIGSDKPDRLRDFYGEVVGLRPMFEMTPGAFGLAGSEVPILIVEPHSAVHGPAKEPQRVLLNFLVDDMAAEVKRIRSSGTEFEREPYEEVGVGLFATFSDVDGNLCQLVQLFG
jgi:predicted enzyme related to lactoylglutathione lyase